MSLPSTSCDGGVASKSCDSHYLIPPSCGEGSIASPIVITDSALTDSTLECAPPSSSNHQQSSSISLLPSELTRPPSSSNVCAQQISEEGLGVQQRMEEGKGKKESNASGVGSVGVGGSGSGDGDSEESDKAAVVKKDDDDDDDFKVSKKRFRAPSKSTRLVSSLTLSAHAREGYSSRLVCLSVTL